MGNFAVTVKDVDWDKDHAGFDAGQIQVDHLHAIRQVNAESIAFSEPARQQ